MGAKKKNIPQPVTEPGNPFKKRWFTSFRPVLIATAIAIVTLLVFLPSLKNDFVNWDDQDYVTENPLVVNDHVPVKEIFSKPVSGNYHPLTILTLAWNYEEGKLAPSGYHVINLLFHLLNTLLVFLFIYLLTGRNVLMASIVSLFFGIHPMHVESVAWISERKDVLYVFFFLSGLLTYLYYRKSGEIAWYVATALLFILSCLSKGMAVIFPVTLLLIDYYLSVKWNYKLLIEKAPLFLFSLCFGLVTYHFQQQGLPPDIVIYSPFYKIIFGCYGAIMYIVKLFVPTGLSAFYPYPSKANVFSYLIYFPFIFLGLVALSYFFLRKEKAIVFGLLFYLVSVALVLQLITVGSAIIADRYTYLSYIGLLFAVSYVVNKSWREKGTILASMKYPLIGIVLLAAIIFSSQTYVRILVWKNGESLWTNVINKYPKQFIGYANLAEYYQGINEDDKALAGFTNALQLNPYYDEAYNNRGLIYYKQGKYNLALEDYNNGIKYTRDKSKFSSYFANRGLAFMRLKNNNNAEQDFTTAFSYYSSAPTGKRLRLLINRGYFYDQTTQYEKAIADYSKYLEMKPEDDVIYNARGLCEVKLNQIQDAFYDFSKAAEFNPSVPNYWLNRSLSENTLGKNADARADAITAQHLGMVVDTNYLKLLGNR